MGIRRLIPKFVQTSNVHKKKLYIYIFGYRMNYL